MFWRLGGFSFNNTSVIGKILEKPPEEINLSELVSKDTFLDEYHRSNAKLIEFLRQETVLDELIQYILSEPLADSESESNRLAFLASEVLGGDSWSIYETLTHNEELMRKLWTFIDLPSFTPLRAAFFAKINEQLLEKKSQTLISFIKTIPNIVQKLFQRIEVSSIMDFILKMISLDYPDSNLVICDWLNEAGFIDFLVNLLGSTVEPEKQMTAADYLKAIVSLSANTAEEGAIGPNSLSRTLISERMMTKMLNFMVHPTDPWAKSSLINIVPIIIDIIRKNNSDYNMVKFDITNDEEPSQRDPLYLGTMLRLFTARLHDFQELLIKQDQNIRQASFGEFKPLTFSSFCICELYAELLHCSNMALLSDPEAENKILERDLARQKMFSNSQIAEQEAKIIQSSSPGDYFKREFLNQRIVPFMIDIFFAYPWNNFLHNVVYDLIQQILTGSMDKDLNKEIAISLFSDGVICKRITSCREYTSFEGNGMGFRMGYMGHLTLISEEILKFVDNYNPIDLFSKAILEEISIEAWTKYVQITLAQTHARDNQIFGDEKQESSPTFCNVGMIASSKFSDQINSRPFQDLVISDDEDDEEEQLKQSHNADMEIFKNDQELLVNSLLSDDNQSSSEDDDYLEEDDKKPISILNNDSADFNLNHEF